MIIKKIDSYNYLIKIIDNELIIKDIYNKEEIELLIKNVITRLLKNRSIKGTLIFNIYIDLYDNLIIRVNNIISKVSNNYLNIKINFHLNNVFLYKIDYFDIKKIKSNNYNLYYYKDNFYLKPNSKINYNLLELSEIIYDDKCQDIINKGILIT